MMDNEIYAAIIPIIARGFIDCGISGVTVKQANQPTQQGANSGPTCYLSKIGNRRYGSPKRADDFDGVTGAFEHRETQFYESQFQVTCLSKQGAATKNQPTADDILQGAIYGLQSDSGLSALRAAGLGTLRITESNNPPFQDDERLFEYSPSFTFTVLHEQDIVTATPAVESYEYRIARA